MVEKSILYSITSKQENTNSSVVFENYAFVGVDATSLFGDMFSSVQHRMILRRLTQIAIIIITPVRTYLDIIIPRAARNKSD